MSALSPFYFLIPQEEFSVSADEHLSKPNVPTPDV